jgi:hypothetical protein
LILEKKLEVILLPICFSKTSIKRTRNKEYRKPLLHGTRKNKKYYALLRQLRKMKGRQQLRVVLAGGVLGVEPLQCLIIISPLPVSCGGPFN